MKKLFLLLLFTNVITAQVSSIVRNKDSYTQEVFPYKGVRAIQIDEVNSQETRIMYLFFLRLKKMQIQIKCIFNGLQKLMINGS